MEDEERVKFVKESKRKRKSIMGSAETSEASKIINGSIVLDKFMDAEVQQAASTLLAMSKEVLDPKTANGLRKRVMKTKLKLDRGIGGKLPRLPPVARLNGVIGTCSEPFEKQLTGSDVSKCQCRLTLSKEEVLDSILPLLNEQDENIDSGIPVTVYDSSGKDYRMAFQSWSKRKLYVLKSGWTKFCLDHHLQALDWVTIWLFRHMHTRSPCFVLSLRR